MNIDIETNYNSDKVELVYDDDGKCIGKLWPNLESCARRLLPAPKHRVPHLRLVTVRGKRT